MEVTHTMTPEEEESWVRNPVSEVRPQQQPKYTIKFKVSSTKAGEGWEVTANGDDVDEVENDAQRMRHFAIHQSKQNPQPYPSRHDKEPLHLAE